MMQCNAVFWGSGPPSYIMAFIERNECKQKQEYFHILSLSWNESDLWLMVNS